MFFFPNRASQARTMLLYCIVAAKQYGKLCIVLSVGACAGLGTGRKSCVQQHAAARRIGPWGWGSALGKRGYERPLRWRARPV